MWVVQRNVRSKSKKCEKKLEVWEKLICVRKVIEEWDICNQIERSWRKSEKFEKRGYIWEKVWGIWKIWEKCKNLDFWEKWENHEVCWQSNICKKTTRSVRIATKIYMCEKKWDICAKCKKSDMCEKMWE